MVIAAVIPAYDCARSIGRVVRGALRQADRVFVVDDGSADGTAAAALKAGATVIRLERNQGKAAALRIGVAAVRRLHPDFMVFLDADGQHDPDEIPILIRALKEERADICIGTRLAKGRHPSMPPHRYISNSFSSRLTSRLTGFRITDLSSGFRAFNRRAIRRLSFEGHRYEIELAMILEASSKGLRICEVAIRTIYGRGQRSNINPAKLIIGTGRLWLRWVFQKRKGS